MRIALIHALKHSIVPIEASFARLWPDARLMNLLDDNTVMVVASSMGQKPFITSLKKGKRVGQLRSLDKLVDILGAEGRVRALSTMSLTGARDGGLLLGYGRLPEERIDGAVTALASVIGRSA